MMVRRSLRCFATMILVLLAAGSAAAQEQDPKSATGFSATGVYHTGDYDNVNLFNGNLIVTLPVGSTFPVGGNLSYGLTLVYNSKIWNPKTKTTTIPPCIDGCVHAEPEKTSNAGLGWTLTMGRILRGCASLPCAAFPTQVTNSYQSSDGAVHVFYDKLHDSDGASPSGVIGYTRDGTYLRLRLLSDGYEIDFPDGSVRHFVAGTDTSVMQMSEMRDAFGNHVTLTWATDKSWTVADTNRTQSVSVVSNTNVQANFQTLISKVALTAPNNRTVAYKFNYDTAASPHRGCVVGTPWPEDGDNTVSVPELTSVEIRDGAASETSGALQTYSFHYSTNVDDCSTGALDRMQLPTGGTITWTYKVYSLPGSVCGQGDPVLMEGVAFRDHWKDATCTAREDSTCTSNLIGEWSYATKLVRNYAATATVNCSDAFNPPDIVVATESEMVNTVTAPGGHTSENHFSVWNATPLAPDGSRKDEYGLPFGRSAVVLGPNNVPRYIAVEQQDCSSTCIGKRSTFVMYQRDDPYSYEKGNACNRRVAGSRTVFLDDVVDSQTKRYRDTASSNFDGLGHYRTSTVTGNFTADDTRVETTNFNPSAGIYPGSFTLPSNWLIQTYDEQSVTEHGAAAKKTFTFDTHGALATARLLKNSSATPGGISTDDHDVLAAFCRDSLGNVTSERFFGGDRNTVGTRTFCSSTPVYANGEYEVDHTYSTYGPRETSSYAGVTGTFFSFDQTVEKSGVATSSRDISTVQTDFEYDVLGRVIWSKPAGSAWTEYVYKNAGETYGGVTIDVPTVFVNLRQGSKTAAIEVESKYEYDTFGRLTHEYRKMPLAGGLTWVQRDTTYTGAGLKQTESVWHESGQTAAVTTWNSYDPFGRPASVTSPDSKTTSFGYTGVSTTTKTSSVATSSTSEQNAIVTEHYDAQGHLISVTEPSGPTSATSPAGANVITTYTYDVGGRLKTVHMVAPDGQVQDRYFNYDNRGFLTSEMHPESGTTFYDSYDSRGHVGMRTFGAASQLQDLQFTYDAAERLTNIGYRNPYYPMNYAPSPWNAQFRPLKTFGFATANDTVNNDWKLGKLETATRYNWAAKFPTILPSSYLFIVTETYGYKDAAGRKTDRSTDIQADDGSFTLHHVKTISQHVDYNDLGLPSLIKYPLCVDCAVPPDGVITRDVTPTYTGGFTTGVSAGTVNYATSISYWPGGLLHTVTHGNGMIDTQEVDVSGISRPRSIKFESWADCTAPAIAIDVADQPAVSAGQSVTLSVTATGTTTLTYQWYEGDTKIVGATGLSYTFTATSSKQYHVEVTNPCRTISSRTATVTVNAACVAPTALSAGWTNVAAGTSVTMTVRQTGTTPFTYAWYRGTPGDTAHSVALVGTSATCTISSITSSDTYWALVSNSCGSSNWSQSFNVILPAPTALTATRVTNTSISLTWGAATNATSYALERRFNGSQFAQLATTTATSYTDSGLTAGLTYVYRVRAVGASGASASGGTMTTYSDYSKADLATLMTFTSVSSTSPITIGVYAELLTGLNALRLASGWAAVTWTNILPPGVPAPASGVVIHSEHTASLRRWIDQALQSLSVPVPIYTDPNLSDAAVRLTHVTQLQQRMQ